MHMIASIIIIIFVSKITDIYGRRVENIYKESDPRSFNSGPADIKPVFRNHSIFEWDSGIINYWRFM